MHQNSCTTAPVKADSPHCHLQLLCIDGAGAVRVEQVKRLSATGRVRPLVLLIGHHSLESGWRNREPEAARSVAACYTALSVLTGLCSTKRRRSSERDRAAHLISCFCSSVKPCALPPFLSLARSGDCFPVALLQHMGIADKQGQELRCTVQSQQT